MSRNGLAIGQLTMATGVSADGKVVVGIGTNAQGKPEACIVDWTGETLPKRDQH